MLDKARELDKKYILPTFGRYDVEFVRGEGVWLFDSDGQKYLDFLASIAVCCLGHGDKDVTAAISEQASELMTASNYFYSEKRGQVAKHISELLNRSSEDEYVWKSFFTNSGAESNECALKIARLAANKNGDNSGKNTRVITLKNSFHGRTMETLAATAQNRFHVGFAPMSPVFCEVEANNIDELKSLFDAHGSEIAAMIVEPIQGESGVNPLTKEYMQLVRELTSEHDAFMICDEIQTGIFRTGRPFAFQHFGVVPDIVSMAKGIGGGFPCGVCAARGKAAEVFGPGDHGTTFGGSALACAAIEATLNKVDSAQLANNVDEVGTYFSQNLANIPEIDIVRGRGLMIGAVLQDRISAKEVVKTALYDEHLVINATDDSTLRFLPPLIVSKEDVDLCLEKLTCSIAKVLAN